MHDESIPSFAINYVGPAMPMVSPKTSCLLPYSKYIQTGHRLRPKFMKGENLYQAIAEVNIRPGQTTRQQTIQKARLLIQRREGLDNLS